MSPGTFREGQAQTHASKEFYVGYSMISIQRFGYTKYVRENDYEEGGLPKVNGMRLKGGSTSLKQEA
ncbi:hypothetical protein EU537_09125 [Candidatus Thorarchaeota archaeon]|nr:MAG: hypothetical protein EU537_09125 [Candidatus Thorarchaeota archaeon]